MWAELGVTGAGHRGRHVGLRRGRSRTRRCADGFRGGDDSWLDPWNGTATPTDHGGHGTHTIGTAVGRGGIGVAPGAQWIGCVNLDRNLGQPGALPGLPAVHAGAYPPGGDPFTDGRPERAPHVLTNSWGCPSWRAATPESLRPAVAALRAAGIFVVAAAGNTGPHCGSVDDPLATYEDAFSVGAVDQAGGSPNSPAAGPVAGGARQARYRRARRGRALRAARAARTAARRHLHGGPHVAGVVALMWSANPRLIGDIGTGAILRETATRRPDRG